MKQLIKILLITLLTSWVMVSCLQSCQTQKHITSEKVITDSTAIKIKSDSIRILKNTVAQLEVVIHELKNSTVQFDTTDCPPTKIEIPEDCNTDELVAIINRLNNRVKIYADGTIEAEGRIRNANVLKELQEKLTATLKEKYDSLAIELQAEKQNVKKETVTKEKVVERKVMTGLAWWLIGFSFIGGILFSKKILS